MKPDKNTVWSYIGPDTSGCPQRQQHLVVYSSPLEVITIGIPFGQGGTWLGSPNDFEKQFSYRGTIKQ